MKHLGAALRKKSLFMTPENISVKKGIRTLQRFFGEKRNKRPEAALPRLKKTTNLAVYLNQPCL